MDTTEVKDGSYSPKVKNLFAEYVQYFNHSVVNVLRNLISDTKYEFFLWIRYEEDGQTVYVNVPDTLYPRIVVSVNSDTVQVSIMPGSSVVSIKFTVERSAPSIVGEMARELVALMDSHLVI